MIKSSAREACDQVKFVYPALEYPALENYASLFERKLQLNRLTVLRMAIRRHLDAFAKA